MRTLSSLAPRLLLIALALGALGLAGCKTQRRFGERKPIPQWYHNFTSKYNGYFNANEIVEIAEEELTDGRKLDYSELLPIYPAYTSPDAKGQAPQLDKAMEKVSLVVNIHRPSVYEDDSYLLLGKAQLLKQDLEEAEHTFEYAVKDFDPANETARLRRIEKQRIADGKAKAKKQRARRTRSTGPARARPKTSRRRSSAAQRNKSRKRGSSSQSRRKAPDTQRKSSGGNAKSKRGKPAKRKSRAEMAREQREARLAEEKAAAKAAADKERAEAEAAEKAAEAEAKRLEALANQEVPKATDALDDGEGLAAPTTTEEKPKQGIFRHETALQDLNYWLARTYIAREKYTDAERVLGKLARSGATFDDVRAKLPAAFAELYIKRGDYPAAAPYLEDAIALTKSRRDRARYSYILGQLHLDLGDARAANADFRRVIKLKPDFEMVFNAELNLATTDFQTGTADAAATLKTLRRMSREDKYAEYRDQVFFRMAEVALDAGDRPGGIDYLQQGLAANTGNQSAAARAYLKLGDLFFQDEDYVLANNYYDSTLQVLPRDDARYAEVEAYSKALGPIAANLQTIALQDSLLAIAELPRDEQRALAQRLEEARRAEARQRAIEASRQAANAPAGATAGRPRRANAGQAATSFFAYDERAKRRGSRAFQRRWGDRPLVDNWRTLDSRESNAVASEIQVASTAAGVTDEEVDEILKAVPNDDAAVAVADGKIQAAFIGLGRQYRDNLQNPQKAADALEELLRRYPGTEYAAEALYLAALAYDELGRPADAKRLRERLVREHPDTDYAKSISNPAFFDEARGAERALVEYYDATFAAFERGQMQDVLQRITDMPAEFAEDNPLAPRFALLGSMATGKAEGKDAYVGKLRGVVSKYPSSEEATRAKEILRLLGERAGASGALDQASTAGGAGKDATSNFKVEPEKSHYFLAALTKGANMSKAKANVADYNGEFHRLDKLAIGNVYMMSSGEQTPVIVVRRFKSQEEALNYYAGAADKKEGFIAESAFTPLIISQTNYREVLRSKSFAEYVDFFNANYL